MEEPKADISQSFINLGESYQHLQEADSLILPKVVMDLSDEAEEPETAEEVLKPKVELTNEEKNFMEMIEAEA